MALPNAFLNTAPNAKKKKEELGAFQQPALQNTQAANTKRPSDLQAPATIAAKPAPVKTAAPAPAQIDMNKTLAPLLNTSGLATSGIKEAAITAPSKAAQQRPDIQSVSQALAPNREAFSTNIPAKESRLDAMLSPIGAPPVAAPTSPQGALSAAPALNKPVEIPTSALATQKPELLPGLQEGMLGKPALGGLEGMGGVQAKPQLGLPPTTSQGMGPNGPLGLGGGFPEGPRGPGLPPGPGGGGLPPTGPQGPGGLKGPSVPDIQGLTRDLLNRQSPLAQRPNFPSAQQGLNQKAKEEISLQTVMPNIAYELRNPQFDFMNEALASSRYPESPKYETFLDQPINLSSGASRFVNFDRILAANAPAARGMAKQSIGEVGKRGEAATKAVRDLEASFAKDVAAGTKKYGGEEIRPAEQEAYTYYPNQSAGYLGMGVQQGPGLMYEPEKPIDISEAERRANELYSGPSQEEFFKKEGYNAAKEAALKAKEGSQALSSEAGLESLINQLYGTPGGTGGSRLDMALAKAAGGRAYSEAQNRFKNVDSLLDTAAKNAQQQVLAGQATSAETAQKFKDLVKAYRDEEKYWQEVEDQRAQGTNAPGKGGRRIIAVGIG